MTVLVVVELLSAGAFLYLRPLPGLLQYGPQLAVLALGVLGLVPAKSDCELLTAQSSLCLTCSV